MHEKPPVRLIACDIDGTLLQKGARNISPEIFQEIDRLEQRGVLFCPASGRQYTSLRRLFAPVADRVPFLCENGAVVYGPGSPGPILSKTVMDRRLSEELCADMLALPGASRPGAAQNRDGPGSSGGAVLGNSGRSRLRGAHLRGQHQLSVPQGGRH